MESARSPPRALAATVGDTKNFSDGRQLSVGVGFVPNQESSAGKTGLSGISQRSDACPRASLLHRVRSVVWAAQRHTGSADRCAQGLLERHHTNVVAEAMAVADKTASILWALLANDRQYDPRHASLPVTAQQHAASSRHSRKTANIRAKDCGVMELLE